MLAWLTLRCLSRRSCQVCHGETVFPGCGDTINGGSGAGNRSENGNGSGNKDGTGGSGRSGFGNIRLVCPRVSVLCQLCTVACLMPCAAGFCCGAVALVERCLFLCVPWLRALSRHCRVCLPCCNACVHASYPFPWTRRSRATDKRP